MAAVALQNLSKRYGKLQALDSVNLTIGQGEFFGLLGPNGAGKTTLISILAGLVRPDSGQAFIMGFDVDADYQKARSRLGVVPQELVFDPFFTVREVLQFQSGYYGIQKNDSWIDELLDNLGLTSKANVNMRALSGGMKRRVLVAQALVHKPPVIVLDEPTAGVDVELRQSLWSFIQRLNQQGHTILLTTHYLEEAEKLCGRVAMLKQGKIVALEETAALLARFAQCTVHIEAERHPVLEGRSMCIQDAKATIHLESPQALEAILAAYREAKITIRHLSTQEVDLEAAFLAIMRTPQER